jgi:hypothetical protein
LAAGLPYHENARQRAGSSQLLNFVVAQLYNEADEILTTLLEQRQAQTLDEQEMLEIVATALELVIDYRRQP